MDGQKKEKGRCQTSSQQGVFEHLLLYFAHDERFYIICSPKIKFHNTIIG